jgi:hypothetical protein
MAEKKYVAMQKLFIKKIKKKKSIEKMDVSEILKQWVL